MLQELFIRSFALIDELRLSFPAGLSVITGETGAGKSIVIDALGMALGARVSGADMVRTGSERCTVEAVFDLSDAPPSTTAFLDEQGLLDDDEPGALTVARELTRAGKNVCRINGRTVPLGVLREATDGLIDVHGQHEHQTLLAPERHIALLDDWLGDSAISLRVEVGRSFTLASKLRSRLRELTDSARERARNLDLYRFQKDEIESAHLCPNEEEELATERGRLVNADKLRGFADEAYSALSEIALEGLNAAEASVRRGCALDSTLDLGAQQISDALSSAEEARRNLRRYRDEIEFEPARLDEVDERIDLIRSLKRKYGESLEEIAAYCADITSKLDEIVSADGIEARLAQEADEAESGLMRAAKSLSATRRAGSSRFAAAIESELRDLGMAPCRFEVSIETRQVSTSGIDAVEFRISANPGEPLKALAKIASGGELSRIMLALKSVLARAAYVPTLIFDEIDIGVGGRTASTIAEKLATLSLTAQVLCITHLPQIASQPAAAHFAIDKRAGTDLTTVHIAPLDAEGRVDEITRMLGGTKQSEAAVRHARAMLGSPT